MNQHRAEVHGRVKIPPCRERASTSTDLAFWVSKQIGSPDHPPWVSWLDYSILSGISRTPRSGVQVCPGLKQITFCICVAKLKEEWAKSRKTPSQQRLVCPFHHQDLREFRSSTTHLASSIASTTPQLRHRCRAGL